MPAIDIKRWIEAVIEANRQTRQRRLVLMQGTRHWCDSGLAEMRRIDAFLRLFSGRHADAVAPAAASSLLGGESDLVVVDLFEGADPDLLCIASGLVGCGGVLVLMAPPITDWQAEDDRIAQWQLGSRSARPAFAAYLFEQIDSDQKVALRVTEDSEVIGIPSLPSLEPTAITAGRTREQTQALSRIEHWLETAATGVVMICADRGRGKSVCLGLLARRLQEDDPGGVVLTSHSRQTASAVLAQAPQLRFYAPDRLLEERPDCELIIIDEAAMIPLSLLRSICRNHARVVMATTTGGYEGTGQGFLLRFATEFNPETLLRIDFEHPVRWCQHDLLERWMNRVLLLDGEADAPPPATDIAFECFDGGGSMPRLRQIYRLLSSAHYRTRPSDLRMMMENPDIRIIMAVSGDHLLGALLLNLEGGLDTALCREVFLGARRPRGHLLAQMLTAQAGVPDFATHRGLRVLRIAVTESHRRQGIGGSLLQRAIDYAARRGLDYIGASFALDRSHLNFWRACGLSMAHIGYASGKSSGRHSIVVLKSISQRIDAVIPQLHDRIQRQLGGWLTRFLSDLDAADVAAILRFAGFRADISELERHEVIAFATGHKGFELCFGSLQKTVMQAVAQGGEIEDALLIEKTVQDRSWRQLRGSDPGSGRRMLEKRLRSLVEALIKD